MNKNLNEREARVKQMKRRSDEQAGWGRNLAVDADRIVTLGEERESVHSPRPLTLLHP